MIENIVIQSSVGIPVVKDGDVGGGCGPLSRLLLSLRHLIDHLDEGLLVFDRVGVQAEDRLQDCRGVLLHT